MGISWGLKKLGLRIRGLDGGPLSGLYPVKSRYQVSIGQRVEIALQRTLNGVLGGFLSSVHALELTVPHKKVAEPV
jgi:hypothetical protein